MIAGFPILPLAQMLLEMTQKNRGTPPSDDHRANVEMVAKIADEHDQAQDARISALERRLVTLERSLELMIRARRL